MLALHRCGATLSFLHFYAEHKLDHKVRAMSSFMSVYIVCKTASFLFLFQVKIWFQNRRSKFKKLWKNGEIPPEQHVASSESPPCHSPPVNSAWDFPPNQRMNSVSSALAPSSGSPSTTAPSFLTNYSWYSSTNSGAHLQANALAQHHHNTAVSAGTIFWQQRKWLLRKTG